MAPRAICLHHVTLLFAAVVMTSLRGTFAQTNVRFSIPQQTVADCAVGDSDVYHEFYDISQMACEPCLQNNTIQTVSEDGLRCVCRPEFRISYHLGNDGLLFCAQCADDEVASLDGWECVTCSTTVAPPSGECPVCALPDDLEADRDIFGSWLVDTNNDTTLTCVTCQNGTLPDYTNSRCTRCDQQLAVQPNVGCACPVERLADGLCFGSVDDLLAATAVDYTITYRTLENTLSVSSDYFTKNVRAAQASCTNFTELDPATRIDYSNLTSCQHLANMCVMTLYDTRYEPPNPANDPCSLYLRLVQLYTGSTFPSHQPGVRANDQRIQAWRANMPWIYYLHDLDDAPEDVLADVTITQEFTRQSQLRIMAAVYNLTGHYLGIQDVKDNMLLMCGDGTSLVDAAFTFGTEYSKKCSVSVDRLFNATEEPLLFYDLYLQFTDTTQQTQLHAIPILLTNYSTADDQYPNEETDVTAWQLLRRYFVLDLVGGVEPDAVSPTVVRYLKEAHLVIFQQPEAQAGLIYTPYLRLTYDYITTAEYGQGGSTQVTFSVRYTTDLSETSRNLYIAIGVIGAAALVLALFQTSTWNKREGKISIDCLTILVSVLFIAGNLANAFFLVSFGYALWLFIVYKAQNVMYVVPNDDIDYYIKAFIGSAFALKFLQLLQLIITQSRADIFFIDWEKPKRPSGGSKRELPARNEAEAYTKSNGPPVSIWRSYLVANEWVELMTLRKIRPFWQLALTLLILHVLGVENLARVETASNVRYAAHQYTPPYSLVFRFALSAGVYIGLALLQWLFQTVIWQRCVDDPVMNFVDLCSLSNVSVFVLPHQQYGYYIHGRSAHGQGDVGLEDMYLNLMREEDGICSQRGLEPGSDEQTFEIFVPRKLREEYNRILFSVYQQTRAAASRKWSTSAESKLDADTDKRIQAYEVINKFMQNYIDHNLKKVDYTFSRKNLWQRISDSEEIENFEAGYFFIDPHHCFDRLLFYGQETVLVLFEILTFTVVDFASENFILSAVITYILIELIHLVRHGLGKKNVGSKTMTDERFLI